jgi:aminomethyltransferase
VKKTPLYETHVKQGGKIIEFGGWALPVQYTGIIEEHNNVRNAAGLFDVSHMGEITVRGSGATGFIQKLITNDISAQKELQVVYSPMCYPDGGVVDDLLVYKFNSEYYLLVVNASNTDKDYEWICDNLEGDVKAVNISDRYAQLAIQGPKAEAVLQKLTETDLSALKFFYFQPSVNIEGIKALISRTGYTGEDGFEIYTAPENAPILWEKLLAAGSEEGLTPVGLGARDTLRFEAALPLYGQEISKDITPLEAGLGKFVKLNKESFTGREALLKQKEQGLKRKLVGLNMVDRGVPRSHYDIQTDGRNIGFVTTGCYSPTLKKNIALALVDINYANEGTMLDVVIRGKALKAEVVRVPFYSKKYKK